jgi:hypothetical protein
MTPDGAEPDTPSITTIAASAVCLKILNDLRGLPKNGLRRGTPARVASPTRQPWRGLFVLLAGVVFLGFSLRHAVTIVSPLLSTVQRYIGLTSGRRHHLWRAADDHVRERRLHHADGDPGIGLPQAALWPWGSVRWAR